MKQQHGETSREEIKVSYDVIKSILRGKAINDDFDDLKTRTKLT